MNKSHHLQILGLLCALSLLLGGCLIKPARVPVRQFILAPIPAPEHAPQQPLSVEVGLVKMPSYLLRNSMVVRKSATEFEYLETALWAERLDQSFRQTLANNISSLLSSNGVSLPASDRDRLVVRVSVEVKQFDVDTQGRGTLLASWRLTFPESDRPAQTGETHLTQTGTSPPSPQAIATTMSALTAEFSKELAKALMEPIQSPQR